jgi:electron transfer flavoprotein beta subunit
MLSSQIKEAHVSLTSLVFVKQVPDTQNITGEAMKADGTVNRAALPAIFNPEDLNALEFALALKDQVGGKVVVCTMGPPKATAVLRQSLYMGADEAILLTDRGFAGADTLATSYALSAAARKVGNYDLILCGHQAIDGDTAQVGPQIAEKLELPQLTYVEGLEKVDAKGKLLRVRCQIEGGYEILESPMPVLLTVAGSANVPRPSSAKRLMRYKKAVTRSELLAQHGNRDYEEAAQEAEEEARLRSQMLWIHEWSAADVQADASRIGLAGSPTKVKQIESVKLGGHDYEDVPPTDEAIQTLVGNLIAEHILS